MLRLLNVTTVGLNWSFQYLYPEHNFFLQDIYKNYILLMKINLMALEGLFGTDDYVQNIEE